MRISSGLPKYYEDGAIKVIPAVAPTMRRNTAGVEVAEGGRAELRPKYYVEDVDVGRTMDFTWKAWQQYLAFRIDYFELPFLATQDTLTGRSASPVEPVVAAVEAVANTEVVEILEDDNGDWVLERAFGLDEAEGVEVKKRLLDLQKNCSERRRKFPSTVANAVDWARELLAFVDTLASIAQRATKVGRMKTLKAEVEAARGEAYVAKARVKELIWLRDSTKLLAVGALWEAGENHASKMKTVIEAAKMHKSDLTKACDKAVTFCESVTADQKESACRCHHVLSSVRQLVKAHEDGKDEASDTVE